MDHEDRRLAASVGLNWHQAQKLMAEANEDSHMPRHLPPDDEGETLEQQLHRQLGQRDFGIRRHPNFD